MPKVRLTVGFARELLPSMSASQPVLPRLGDLELAALDHLWDEGEADVQQVHAAVGAPRGISVNTVGSALERLHKKGLLARTKVSHAYRYRPLLSREDYRARRLLEAAGGVAELGKRGTLAAFVDLVADSDDSALGELERLIRQKRRRTKGQKGDAS